MKFFRGHAAIQNGVRSRVVKFFRNSENCFSRLESGFSDGFVRFSMRVDWGHFLDVTPLSGNLLQVGFCSKNSF